MIATLWFGPCLASIGMGPHNVLAGRRPDISHAAVMRSSKYIRLHGVVKSVDPASHKIDIVGLPFWEFVWRQYARNRTVAPEIDLGAIEVGARVKFSLSLDENGTYYVSKLTPQPSR